MGDDTPFAVSNVAHDHGAAGGVELIGHIHEHLTAEKIAELGLARELF